MPEENEPMIDEIARRNRQLVDPPLAGAAAFVESLVDEVCVAVYRAVGWIESKVRP